MNQKSEQGAAPISHGEVAIQILVGLLAGPLLILGVYQGTAAQGYEQAVVVPVTFDVTGADASMPDGYKMWTYILARHSDDAPWLIVSNGR